MFRTIQSLRFAPLKTKSILIFNKFFPIVENTRNRLRQGLSQGTVSLSKSKKVEFLRVNRSIGKLYRKLCSQVRFAAKLKSIAWSVSVCTLLGKAEGKIYYFFQLSTETAKTIRSSLLPNYFLHNEKNSERSGLHTSEHLIRSRWKRTWCVCGSLTSQPPHQLCDATYRQLTLFTPI